MRFVTAILAGFMAGLALLAGSASAESAGFSPPFAAEESTTHAESFGNVTWWRRGQDFRMAAISAVRRIGSCRPEHAWH